MDYFSTRENQELMFLPTNDISDTIWYKSQDSEDNQRLIVDIPNNNPVWTPNVWQVSKIERVNVKGRTRVTLFQHEFDQHHDYIEKDSNGNIIGMWADYYYNSVEPEISSPTDNINDNLGILDNVDENNTTLKLTATNNVIKIGGSYKTITATLSDGSNILRPNWKYGLFDPKANTKTDILDTSDLVTISSPSDNKIKIKFKNDLSYIGKILIVSCNVGGFSDSIQFELISL